MRLKQKRLQIKLHQEQLQQELQHHVKYIHLFILSVFIIIIIYLFFFLFVFAFKKKKKRFKKSFMTPKLQEEKTYVMSLYSIPEMQMQCLFQ